MAKLFATFKQYFRPQLNTSFLCKQKGIYLFLFIFNMWYTNGENILSNTNYNLILLNDKKSLKNVNGWFNVSPGWEFSPVMKFGEISHIIRIWLLEKE